MSTDKPDVPPAPADLAYTPPVATPVAEEVVPGPAAEPVAPAAYVGSEQLERGREVWADGRRMVVFAVLSPSSIDCRWMNEMGKLMRAVYEPAALSLEGDNG